MDENIEGNKSKKYEILVGIKEQNDLDGYSVKALMMSNVLHIVFSHFVKE